MTDHRSIGDSASQPPSRTRERRLTALCALVAGGSHIPLISEHLREAPYIGWSFIVLVAASVFIAIAVLRTDKPTIWIAVGLVYAVALLVYLLSRTVGLPQIPDDVGNWTEPESYPALISEALAVFIAVKVVFANFSRRVAIARPQT